MSKKKRRRLVVKYGYPKMWEKEDGISPGRLVIWAEVV